MKCPFCGEEMEQGVLYTENSRGLCFLPPDVFLGCFDTKKSLEKQGGIVLDGPYRARFNETQLPAQACRKCRKIVLDYGT